MSILFKTGHQLGQDGKEGITYIGTLTKRHSGTCLNTSFSLHKGHKVAVKTFRKNKSTNKIETEAKYQQMCAKAEISPFVYEVNKKEKHIVMQMLDSLPVETYKNEDLPDDLQYKLCALMSRMDDIEVLHADMNAYNVMLDTNGRPYMIDFGFAKKINATVRKKFGDHPNVKVTLWGLSKGFKRNKVGCDILEACVKAKNKTEFFEKGEELLTTNEHRRKRRKR